MEVSLLPRNGSAIRLERGCYAVSGTVVLLAESKTGTFKNTFFEQALLHEQTKGAKEVLRYDVNHNHS